VIVTTSAYTPPSSQRFKGTAEFHSSVNHRYLTSRLWVDLALDSTIISTGPLIKRSKGEPYKAFLQNTAKEIDSQARASTIALDEGSPSRYMSMVNTQ
jgi:hypothetical protein